MTLITHCSGDAEHIALAVCKQFEKELIDLKVSEIRLTMTEGDTVSGNRPYDPIDVECGITGSRETKHHYHQQAMFRLTSLPSCCGILVSHDSYVNETWRRKGVGTLMQRMKEEIARRFKVGQLICTVIHGNKAETTLLEKTGWTKQNEFKNKRSGNMVQVWYKELGHFYV